MSEKLDRIDVLLLAENRLLRESLTRLLNQRNDIQVVAAVASDGGVIERVRELQPRVLAVDCGVFSAMGLEVVMSVRGFVPGVRVLMIGMDSHPETFLRCVRAGVSGYLLKEASANEVAAAVRVIAYEGAVCPPKLCNSLFQEIITLSSSSRLYRGKARMGLTRREQQLVAIISEGLSNKEIGNQLHLSEQTVKNHIYRIMRKLGADDRLSAVEMCRIEGIVA